MSAERSFSGKLALRTFVQPHLDEGETLRWVGRPDPWATLLAKSPLLLIGGFWLTLSLAAYLFGWISSTVSAPLFLAGVAFLAGPIIVTFQTDKVFYAITNRRALIVRMTDKHKIVSVPFERMDDKLEVLETSHRAGHLYFASGYSARLPDTDFAGKLAFLNIADAQDVARILDAARK